MILIILWIMGLCLKIPKNKLDFHIRTPPLQVSRFIQKPLKPKKCKTLFFHDQLTDDEYLQ